MKKNFWFAGIPAFIVAFGMMFFGCDSGVNTSNPGYNNGTQIAAPQDFDVLLNGNQAILSWNMVNGASEYKVNYGTSSSYGFSDTTTETRFVISGLKYSTTYYFAVQAGNNGETGDLSDSVKLTTNSAGVFVDLPEELLAPVKADRSDEDTEGVKPFDYSIFNREKAAWKAQEQNYHFFQLHQCGRYYHSAEDNVQQNTAGAYYELSDEDKSYFMAYTISGVYENITRIWEKMEKKNSPELFLIEYNTEFHYPEYIRIKNYYNSGYDYTVRIHIFTDEDMIDSTPNV
jgi:hypothetical protein